VRPAERARRGEADPPSDIPSATSRDSGVDREMMLARVRPAKPHPTVLACRRGAAVQADREG
jgi:hypothetical protein